MTIDDSSIKAVQEQVDVTYEEAERTLRRTKGNIEEAVHLIRKRRENGFSRMMDDLTNLFWDALRYDLVIVRHEKVHMDLPLLILLGFFLLMPLDTKVWFLIIAMGLILMTECHVSIQKKDEYDKAKTTPKKDQVKTEPIKEEDQETSVQRNPAQGSEEAALNQEIEKDHDDDDYYEITIEK